MSYRLRLALWYAVSLVLLAGTLLVVSHNHLNEELKEEKWERSLPGNEGWVLHGAYTDREIHDILNELAHSWVVYGGGIIAIAFGIGFWLAHVSIKPVLSINRQLKQIGPQSLHRRVDPEDKDPEYQELSVHLNALFDRLDKAFKQLNEFSAKVAHELRTPLTLMRMQVENAASSLDPELSESLQKELSRLTHYVDQSLLIARAEQGRLKIDNKPVVLEEWLPDRLEPFQLLAQTYDRQLNYVMKGPEVTVNIDTSHFTQILNNLLDNAMKHGCGSICIRKTTGYRKKEVNLLVFNQRNCQGKIVLKDSTGLGLRTVEALVAAHPQFSMRTRITKNYWATIVRISG